ncbi:MAG TPA: hypothetical protein VH089_00250 [Streptosporangiaceae bacterium]|nr:hypothetical protein [Streptosporangiaceae bacterium]
MIRRAFWLSVGAAAGIAGYRRASAVGRAVQVRVNGAAQLDAAQPAAAQPTQAPSAPGPFWPPRVAESGSAAQPAYLERRAPASPVARRPAAPVTWSATRTAWRTSRAAWKAQKAAVSGVRSAGRFAHDVREGMDAYMSRQDD